MSGRRVAGVLAAVLAALALAGLSQAPWRANPDDAALLRLSWRVSGRDVETCRPFTEEELARTPAHMRRGDEVCERRGVSYRLRVAVDGRPRVDEPVRPAGVRGDRPLAVLQELPLEAGEHRVHVTFAPVAVDGAPEGVEHLAFEGVLRLAPREVALLTLDDETNRLTTRRPR